jgi:hypothetical protein
MSVVVPSFRTRVLAVLLAGSPLGAVAQEPAPSQNPTSAEDLRQLREELLALQQRMTALAAKIDALQTGAPEAAAVAPVPAAPAAPSAVAQGPPPPAAAPGPEAGAAAGVLPGSGNMAGASKAFNPDISALGDFIAAVPTSSGTIPEPSLQLHEAEVGFQAVVDPYARADFFFTYGPEEVGVEEAYITFPTVPGGLLFKAGKMRDVFGKIDPQHNHTLAFADRPQVTENLTGGEDGLSNPGITLARLIPNPWAFLEITGQLYGGANLVFDAPKASDVSFVGHLRAYRDLGEASNLELGGSFAYGHNNSSPTDYTRLWGADVTFRHRALRRAIYHKFLGRAEFVWSQRQEPSGNQNAFGFYAQAEYQFARRWYFAGRYDYSGRALYPSIIDKGGSLALTFWPSEFSQLRTQYKYIRGTDDTTTNELLFQLQFAIGAHGAHAF